MGRLKIFITLATVLFVAGQSFAARQALNENASPSSKGGLNSNFSKANANFVEIYTALDLKETKAVVQASAPADTTVDWYDTDQESGVLILKRHNGTTWLRASSHGVQYASSCASITAGMCVDTDDGKLYYHNNTSVVEVGSGGSVDLSAYLSKTNTTAFTPTADYHPATKKYVDDSITAGGGYTDEQAQDAAGGMFSGNTETGITVTYNDTTGKVDFVVATTLASFTDDSTHRLVTDTEKTTWNAKQNALGYTPENATNKGTANGYASLGSDGLVPSSQLPPSMGTDDQTAAEVPVTPWGSYTGTNVQVLMQEVDTALRALVSGAALPSWMPSTGPTNGRQILQAVGGCSNTTYDTQTTCEANSGTWTTPTYQHTSVISGLINDTGSAGDDLWSAAKITSELAGKQNTLVAGTDYLTPAAAASTYQTDLSVPDQTEAEAGTSTTERVWTAQRIAQAIVALAPSGGSGSTAASIQMTFASDAALTTQTGSKTKVPTGMAFTTADVGCNASDSITFTLQKSATVNGTYTAVGTVSIAGMAQSEGVDISSWTAMESGYWARIDITSAGSLATECTIAIGGNEQ